MMASVSGLRSIRDSFEGTCRGSASGVHPDALRFLKNAANKMHASVTQPSRSASSRRWHHASADSDVGISHCVGLIRQNKSKNADPDPQKTDSSLAPLQTRNLELRRKGESVSSKGVLVTQRTRRRMESRQRPSRRALHATHRASGRLSMAMKTRGCLRGQSASVGTTVPAENPTPRTHATVPMHGHSIGMAR